MIVEAIAAVSLPLAGWTLNKVVQHERDIAALKQIASDIRDSLRRLEGILDKSQNRSHSR